MADIYQLEFNSASLVRFVVDEMGLSTEAIAAATMPGIAHANTDEGGILVPYDTFERTW